ncbi:MAG: hypothetical protein ACFFDN_38295 [Candidatus Hodarchaeota archaeon]
MRKLKNSRKIISILLLGSFFISLLMLFDINNTLNPTQTQNSLTQDNFTLEQKSPIKDDILSHSSTLDSAPKYNQTFNISQSDDDAFSNFWFKTNNGDGFLQLGLDEPEGGNTGVAVRWDITVPNYAIITKAHINLTIANLSFYGQPYDGFNTSISVFNEPSTNNFSETTEYLWDRPTIGGLPSYLWELNGTELINQTISTIDISDLLEQIMDLDGWNGIIGAYIKPGVGTETFEAVSFYAFEYAKPEYYPKLFVEWCLPPHFTEIPTDMTINNETLGYHINWTAEDNNPLDYYIIGNETINGSPEIVQSGEWQSGVKIRYDIPKIDIQDYDSVIVNYTLYIYDADRLFECDSVLINVIDKGLLTITDVKFIQNNKEVEHFQSGLGPFSVQVYGKQGFNPKITLTAFYPNLIVKAHKRSRMYGVGDYVNVTTWCMGDTKDNPLIYINLPYNSELNCYELLIPSSVDYIWTLWLKLEIPFNPPATYIEGYEYDKIAVQDIRYNINNRFLIENGELVNSEIVCEGRVYNGEWGQCKYEILNDDFTPPAYSEPEFIEPDEADKHYEITINIATEEHGASVKDVFLYYSVDDGVWEETIMVLQEGKYYGEIPPQPEDSEIIYYIKIIDEAGNVIETDEYTEKATIFEKPSLIIPILGIFIAIIGALSIVVIYRHKRKAALKKVISEKKIKKVRKK